MMLDVNAKITGIDWKVRTGAVSQSGDEIPVRIKTQGNYGRFALDGDTLLYIVRVEGNMTDHGVLTLGEGDGAVDVAVEVNRHYWKTLAGGTYYTLAIREDGTLWAWGTNVYGQLGDGTRIDRAEPVQVGSDNDWQSVAASSYHSMGIKTDGTLWAWGRNNYGQLGDGTRSDKYAPVQEPSKSTDWKSVALGNEFSVALKTDGTVWTTGRNNYGQLGDNTTDNHWIFTDVTPAGTTWKGIAAGIYHWGALGEDGTIWSCGRNNYGQLGDGTTTDRHVLTQEASGDTDWSAIASGDYHMLALKTDGRLFGWGLNSSYQIGDGTRTSQTQPTQEASAATDWTAIEAAAYHSVGIKSDGTLWGWGANNYGQLGDKINVTRYSPELLDDTHTWKSVEASRYETQALSDTAAYESWGTSE
jgi:alpha-tubulin suppressor-like RCC1 family protein